MHDPPAMDGKLRIGVLGSGRGSNFRSILEAVQSGRLPAEIAVVIADQPDAGILQIAQSAGIPSFLVEEPKYRTRLSEETAAHILDLLQKHQVNLVALAGFLRVVKEPLLSAFPGRMLNIHPSLLPKYPGLAAWKQALEAGESETGCTVHLVDAGIDTGKILAFERVPIQPGDTAESVHARIQEAEHRLYPEVLGRFAGE
jgi:phosphoribosylglycinamide formyltransferase-1